MRDRHVRYVRVRGLYISGPQVVVIGPSVQTLNESNPQGNC